MRRKQVSWTKRNEVAWIEREVTFADPAPATTFAHLDAITVLSRGLVAKDRGLLLQNH
ncbi:hypothetical protein QJS10_CPB11g01995 [Acorus calamus]|uniref:Uncharacterized protein n=1 Tax=Acorus calamus TaxID=4465 RepID=A0AAV9DVP2_ACOCL|nr:hypothetical protein QJS10_CPB11g01995 [Acorus calamus]